ncbi:VOC family protein, partial [Streptomyces sp. TRM76130]|nr:VOC family protein [Streptomyces sp. TRM76130]
MTATVEGPDFIALQVRDVPAAAAFFEEELGLRRAPGPDHAVVFATTPIPFAVREP